MDTLANCPPDELNPDAYEQARFASSVRPVAISDAVAQLNSRAAALPPDALVASQFVDSAGGVRWGSRMRRIESTRGRRDITFRSSRQSGRKSEIDFLELIDLFLYAWLDGSRVDCWVVFAVAPLLSSGVLDDAPRRWNHDGKSEFLWVDVWSLQEIPNCLLAGKKNPDAAIAYRLTPSNEYLAAKV